MIVIPNRDKKLTSAVDTIVKCLSVMRHLAALQKDKDHSIPPSIPGGTFLMVDPEYPLNVSTSKLTHFPGKKKIDKYKNGKLGHALNGLSVVPNAVPGLLLHFVVDPTRVLLVDEIKEAIQRWAVDYHVSPWMTQMVVRTRGLRKSQITNIRYSLDIDPGDPISLSMQVHSNEPLSRELQAFPVCMVPMPIANEPSIQNVYLRFLQSLWFLKKLFDFHQEGGQNKHPSNDVQRRTNQLSRITTGATSDIQRNSISQNLPYETMKVNSSTPRASTSCKSLTSSKLES